MAKYEGRKLNPEEQKAYNREVTEFNSLAREMVSKLGVADDLIKHFAVNLKKSRDLTDDMGVALKDLTTQQKKDLKFLNESADL